MILKRRRAPEVSLIMSAGTSGTKACPSTFATEEEEDHTAIIAQVSEKLREFSVKRELLNPTEFLKLGYFPEKVRSLLRPFEGEDDEVKLENLIFLGRHHKFFSSVRKCLPRQFYSYLEWLRTPDGQQAINRQWGDHIFTAQEEEWCALFDAQKTEGALRIKDVQSKITELEQQLHAARQQMDGDIKEVHTQYLPVSLYPEPTGAEVAKECWDEYLNECKANGDLPHKWSVKWAREATMTFETRVRKRKVVAWLSDGNRKKELEEYCNERINHFTSAKDERSARRLCNLLGVVTQVPRPRT